MIKKLTSVIIIFLILAVSAGCTKDDREPESLGGRGPGSKPFRVGILLSQPRPGKEDISSYLLSGAKKAEEELGIEYKVLKYGDLIDEAEAFQFLAENEYDLVVAAGQEMSKSLGNAAEQYGDNRFVIVDKVVDKKNVTSILFNEEHGGFLAGVVAASLTKTGILGFIGGSQLDEEAARFENGFLKGIKYINGTEGKGIKAYVSYAGVFADAMIKPEKGKELAHAQYGNGADIIFQTAGNTGDGVYNAAAEARRFVISNDAKQSAKAQWNSYGYIVKNYDKAFYGLIKSAFEGKLQSGVILYGVNSGGLDFISSQSVPVEVNEKIKLIKENFIKGNIKLEKIVAGEDIKLKVPEPAPIQTGSGQAGGSRNGSQQNGQSGRQQTNSGGPNTHTGGNGQGGTNQQGNSTEILPDGQSTEQSQTGEGMTGAENGSENPELIGQ